MVDSMFVKISKFLLAIFFCLIVISTYCSWRDKELEKKQYEYEEISSYITLNRNGEITKTQGDTTVIVKLPEAKQNDE